MKLNRTPLAKFLLSIMSAVLLALILQPAAALADDTMDITYKFSDSYLYFAYQDGTKVTTTVEPGTVGGFPVMGDDNGPWTLKSTDDTKYALAYWTPQSPTMAEVHYGDLVWSVYNFTPITTDVVKHILNAGGNTFVAHTWFLGKSCQVVIQPAQGDNGVKTVPGAVNYVTPEALSLSGNVDFSDLKFNLGYAFDYATCSTPLFVYSNTDAAKNKDTTQGSWTVGTTTTTHTPVTQLTMDQLKLATSEGVNSVIYIHTKQVATHTITYKAGDGGNFDTTDTKTSEEILNDGSSPESIPGILLEDDYTFDGWTADKDVTIPASGTEAAKTITAGQTITTDQLKQITVTDNLELTANFTKPGEDPEPVDPDPVDPDSEPANQDSSDGSGSKLLPKTGDTFSGTTAAAVLAAGALLVVGTKLAFKRASRG